MSDNSNYPYEDPWFEQLPELHRGLAGDEHATVVAPNKQLYQDADPPAGLHLPCVEDSYWTAAYYLMRVLMGWQDCSRGLPKLFENRGSLDGPARFLYNTWGHDRLASMAYFSWKHAKWAGLPPNPSFEKDGWAKKFNFHPDYHQLSEGVLNHVFVHVKPIIEQLQGQGGPYVSIGAQPSPPTIIKTASPRRVALIVDKFENWPVELRRLSEELPRDRGRSWHVHVVAMRFGYIGRFRRCHDCGRWFQGRAIFHKWGHAEEE